MRTRSTLVTLVAAASLLAACSSEKVVSVATSGDSSTSTSTVDTSPIDTSPVVTAAPGTTLPGPQGWTTIDLAGEPGPIAYPCCGSNYWGDPSPPLSGSAGSLTDGRYLVRLDWADDPAQPLVGTVHRLDQCLILPEGSCEPSDTYAPEDLGVDPSVSLPISIPLDGSIRVVLVGFNGWDVPAAVEGNGADLARLVTALDADYREAVLAPLAAGVPKDDIVTGLWASGDHHFGKPNYDSEPAPSELVYTNLGAPSLLFQAAFGFDDTPADNRGVDVLGRPGISVRDGQITLYVYAGWYS